MEMMSFALGGHVSRRDILQFLALPPPISQNSRPKHDKSSKRESEATRRFLLSDGKTIEEAEALAARLFPTQQVASPVITSYDEQRAHYAVSLLLLDGKTKSQAETIAGRIYPRVESTVDETRTSVGGHGLRLWGLPNQRTDLSSELEDADLQFLWLKFETKSLREEAMQRLKTEATGTSAIELGDQLHEATSKPEAEDIITCSHSGIEDDAGEDKFYDAPNTQEPAHMNEREEGQVTSLQKDVDVSNKKGKLGSWAHFKARGSNIFGTIRK